ncbi:ABC transporter permease [Candidatus Weimeria sp. HCP3S3_B5]|uniref:ABC transporter permease n=1 Tax=Candidatus Weimeria sp. HCP3S3_B5 TaxID=3438871 RepID=UPI002A9FB88C|nr:ABC transporter permease [Lachnospiraceae bacterium]
MAKYIVKRVVMAIVAFIIVSAITFFVMNLIPGGPFTSEKAMSKEVIATLNKRYGLDKPVGVQYFNYMKNFLHGDWGISLKTQRAIWPDLRSRFGVSAKLGVSALILALILGIIFGSIQALTRNKWPDRVLVVLTTLGTAIPSFVLATLLMLLFCMQLQLIPVWDVNHPNFILPVISLAVYPMAYITRLTKTSMLDALNQDYITTARAKGVPKLKVIFVHALRNALIPVITYVGPEFAYIITGSMVIESIFTIPGLGTMFVQSINNRDYPYIMAVTIFLALLMIIANLITDILYKIIDPRITFE